MNLICFGDSVTASTNFCEGDRWPGILQRLLDRDRPDCFQVYNRGVGGSTVSQAFDRFEPTVLPLLPGIVLLQFGFNDAHTPAWSREPRVGLAEFRAKLVEFHRLAEASGGRAVFLANHQPVGHALAQGNGRTYEENFAPYNDTVRKLAGELGAPLIDLPALFARHRLGPEEYLAADCIHLTPAGTHRYAAMVYEGLGQAGLV